MTDIEITKEHLNEKKKKGNKSCAICSEKFKLGGDATQLPCKHYFHDLCILKWLKDHNTCPLCRFELMTVDYEYEAKKWKQENDNINDKNSNSSYGSMYS